MSHSRRNFIRNIGAIGSTALLAPVATMAAAEHTTGSDNSEAPNGPLNLTILHTTDVHCQVHPHDELFWENNRPVFRKTGGYAHLHTYLKKEKKKNPHSFLVDTGDMFQGSELSVKTTGAALVPILNALQYDLYLPGNWEVVYGKKNMQTLMGSLHAPKVCANMYHDLGNNQKGETIFPPYYIWQVQGVKIGFIGYTDPLVPLRQSPLYSKGIIYTKPEDNLAHYVQVLRNQEQCAFVIVLAHLGLSQQVHLANHDACAGVDYILGGDTHERVRTPIQCRHAKVVEPGAFGSFVGKLDLQIENGKVVKDSYRLEEINSNTYKPAKEMQALIKKHEAPFERDIHAVAGYSTIPLYRYFVVENPIDTLILDAMKWTMPDADIVLSNGFRFCPPRTTPDHTGNIPITEGYIYDMLPVDSTIRCGTATGKQIKEWLEKEMNNVFAKDASERLGGWLVKFKGMQVRFNAFGEKGKRVQEIKIGGQPLNPDKTYSMCACEREGDPEDMLCRMKGVANTRNTQHTLHTVLKSYLAKFSPVTPVPQLHAQALDAPATLLTQVTGIDYQFR